MLSGRIIPCLLLANGRLVKTTQFSAPEYVGDPVNVVSIFNELETDEIFVLDIMPCRNGEAADWGVIEKIAAACTAPLGFGGGINSIQQMQRLFSLGIEKVILNSHVATDRNLLKEAASRFGSQAIVVSIDARINSSGNYEVFTSGGKNGLSVAPDVYAVGMVEHGAGEILITSVDRDGTMRGYDEELIKIVVDAVDVPVVACGGASSRDELGLPILSGGASAAAVGRLFLYQAKGKGVVINLPTMEERGCILHKRRDQS